MSATWKWTRVARSFASVMARTGYSPSCTRQAVSYVSARAASIIVCISASLCRVDWKSAMRFPNASRCCT